jgi:predicted ATPase/DNA-binding SARP family transcriptional activator
MPDVQFGVLGPLVVGTAPGQPVPVGGPRPRALLVLLLLDAGRVVGVERLIDGQYGDDPPAGAAGAVQTQVSRLRRALGAGVVEFGPGGYRLAVDPDDVDAHRFERLAATGHDRLAAGDPAAAAQALRAALALWRGPALAELPAPNPAAARLEELRLAATEDLVEAELALPAGTSVAELGRLVAAHPLRERLRAQLVRALHVAGRRAEALAEFEKARRLLRAELGADPSPELADAHLAVLRADRPAAPARRRLPAQLTSFVGRENEAARLDSGRLVTLLGPGGAGKTRLAVEWAGRSGADACFVDLAAVPAAAAGAAGPDSAVGAAGTADAGNRSAAGPAAVARAVLGALGLRESGGDPTEQLRAALADQELLLVLDNCEHVRLEAAALARALLADCPGLRLLATSREPLGLTGEVLVALGALPDAEAVALFAQRAAAVRPGFVLDEGTTAAVVTICAALDGLPLAIELAAARLRQFSVAAVAERLGADRFRLLSRGDPTAAERHRSIAAVVAWSWELLGPDERRVARRFAVFAGGAPLSSAAAVCGPDSEDVLVELVDRSLVETDGERYRMLETVREFCARELAAAGEEQPTRRAHAQAHLALAREADPHLRRAEQLEWLARLRAEHANLTGALHWAAEHARPTAFELVAALSAYWWLSGTNTAGAGVASALLEGEPPPGLDEEYVACVVRAAPRAAPEHWERAAEIVRGIDHPLRHPFGAAMWGMTAGPTDEPSPELLAADPWNDALAHLSRVLLGLLGGGAAADEREMLAALTAFERLGDRWGRAQALDWLAMLDGWRGRWASAHGRWAEALRLHEELGALDECAGILFHRGECLLRQGEPDAADADYAEAERLWARAGQPVVAAEVRIGQAEVAAIRGDLDAAGALLDDLVNAPPDGHNEWQAAATWTALGRHAELRGDPVAARRQHAAALTAGRASPLRNDVAAAAEGAAGALLLAADPPAAAGVRGDPAAAAELLGAAVALRGSAMAGNRHVARVAAGATAALGPEAFAAAHARGAALAPEAALAVVDSALARLSAD